MLFISKARLEEVLTTKNVRGAPNLVVEIASPRVIRKRDGTFKTEVVRALWRRGYWVIEPDTDTRMVVHRHDGESYRPISELTAERGNNTLSTSLLPGLTLPLERIFKD